MNILPGYKLCRKKLHQYPADKKRCPACHRECQKRWQEKNSEQVRKNNLHWRKQNSEWVREYSRQWRKKNPEKIQESSRKWYEQNSEKKRESNRRWREQNPNQQRKCELDWYEKNSDRRKETSRNWYKKNSERAKENRQRWYSQNSDKVRAAINRRRARKKQATPPWADQAAINAVYAEAVRLEKETGIKHHVDHIFPLTSPYMCGLHVAENLQVLPGPENLSKGNRSWPGQLECQRSRNPLF